jgi:hypothetical protein
VAKDFIKDARQAVTDIRESEIYAKGWYDRLTKDADAFPDVRDNEKLYGESKVLKGMVFRFEAILSYLDAKTQATSFGQQDRIREAEKDIEQTLKGILETCDEAEHWMTR